jgi:hypothetical protein
MYNVIITLVLALPLLSCDQQNSAENIDVQLGVDCFELHRSALPPGTQYEGIRGLSGNRLEIKIMSGVAVETIECTLAQDGSVRPVDK